MKFHKVSAVAMTTACGLAILSGCSTEKIAADYMMPARQIDDVKSINVLAINVKANVKSSLAADDLSPQTAGMVKQLTTARLYKEGFIQTVDNVWGTAQGGKKIEDFVKGKKSGHGHASFATINQNPEKGALNLTLALTADSKKVTKERDYTLTTVPYTKEVKEGSTPTSKPGKPVVENVKKSYQVFETTVTGTLKAELVAKDGTKLYSAEYPVSMPADAALSSASPSVMKAVSVAVGPAIDEVVADISPYKVTKEFEANQDGDKKAVLLLEAKAFSAAIEAVDALQEKTYADYENQGLAYEASGDFNAAKGSYEEALKLKEDAKGALEGIARIDEVKNAAKQVKASGAKQDSSTTFKSK